MWFYILLPYIVSLTPNRKVKIKNEDYSSGRGATWWLLVDWKWNWRLPIMPKREKVSRKIRKTSVTALQSGQWQFIWGRAVYRRYKTITTQIGNNWHILEYCYCVDIFTGNELLPKRRTKSGTTNLRCSGTSCPEL